MKLEKLMPPRHKFAMLVLKDVLRAMLFYPFAVSNILETVGLKLAIFSSGNIFSWYLNHLKYMCVFKIFE